MVGAITVVAAGCGSSSTSTTASTASTSSTANTSSTSSTPSSSSALTISSAQVTGLGTVLVNSQGRTLYMFVPDHQSKVTCVGTCAAVWPPVLLASGQTAVAAGGVKSSLLGSDPNPGGGKVVTYNKWPLYTFTADTSAGAATGQALNLNGGLWYAISPSGALITKKG